MDTKILIQIYFKSVYMSDLYKDMTFDDPVNQRI
jgi:hypothetical protein